MLNIPTPSLADMTSLPPMTVAEQMPAVWFVAFHPTTERRWLRWLALGRFKHVSCFGWVPSADRWVFFDPALERNWLRLVPDDVAVAEPLHIFDIKADYHGGDIGTLQHTAVVIRLEVQTDKALRPNIWPGRGCVRDVARLIGIRSTALRPDALFKQCLKLGGTVMNPERMTSK